MSSHTKKKYAHKQPNTKSMANNELFKRKREDEDGETKLADVMNAFRDRLDLHEVRARAQEEELQNLKSLKRALEQRVAGLEERMEEKDEELKKKEEELKELKRRVMPTPLWKILTDVQYRDIFETCILPKLYDLEFRVFREVNRESRDAIRRSGWKLRETYEVNVWDEDTRTDKKVTEKIEGEDGQYYFCCQAVVNGNLALLRWFREEKMFEWDEVTINAAANDGYLHIVKYCMKKKCPIDGLACALAAENGHLDILKYLHENDAPWDSRTCRFAAKNNHIDCLNYAKENGCPQYVTSSSSSESEESD